MALVTLNEYKGYYGITNVTQDLEIMSNLVRSEALASAFCGYDLQETSIVDEPYNGGSSSIILKSMPITSVSSVKENNTTIQDYTVIPDEGLIVKGTNLLNTISHSLPIFRPGLNNILISYTSGYTEATSPSDLKLAILKIVKHLFSDRKASSTSNKQVLHGEERAGKNSSSIVELGFLPMDVRDILMSYRLM